MKKKSNLIFPEKKNTKNSKLKKNNSRAKKKQIQSYFDEIHSTFSRSSEINIFPTEKIY